MTDETRRRLESMSKVEREERLNELNHKLGIVQPTILENNPPPESALEDIEEREWLKSDLGYGQR